MKYLLGIDLGSSSVKVALVETDTGRCASSASYPDSESAIKSLQPGWAEQSPDDWWLYFKTALRRAMAAAGADAADVAAIGISYQMHGLVCLDKDLKPLRDAIIWCDSRGVPYGRQAYDALGGDYCLGRLLNSPANFTASKLAWVKENEPELFGKIRYIMLPGDWLALQLTSTPATTECGLSEMMLYDFTTGTVAVDVMNHFGFDESLIPALVPTFGEQGFVSEAAAGELGLCVGTPVTYRAGDQPNNALSLAVLMPGEVASTAGTSGVVYGVADKAVANPRVNTFLHVNHTLGVMHCVSGCGIMNAWLRRTLGVVSYDEMNSLAATVPIGSDGVSVIPFGNGAERVLLGSNPGCSLHGIDFNRHNRAHLMRAAQEGVAFAMCYGMESMGHITAIHAGRANMFLSPLFRQTLASVSGAAIELYDTDGSIGAARGAGIGAGIYASTGDAFPGLNRLTTVEPAADNRYREAYNHWKTILEQINTQKI